MQELLTNYSPSQIIIILVLVAIAIKEVINFIDWAKKRLKGTFEEEDLPRKIATELEKAIEDRKEQIVRLKEEDAMLEKEIASINDKLNLLIASDRDDIKSWITAQHHHFMEKGSIDYYSFECIQKRYDHYKVEGGNSFIDTIMEEINELPKTGKTITRG